MMNNTARLQDWLAGHIGRHIGVDPETITFDKALADYGLDSVDAILMAGELEQVFAMEIDPSTFIQYETFDAMIAALAVTLDSKA